MESHKNKIQEKKKKRRNRPPQKNSEDFDP